MDTDTDRMVEFCWDTVALARTVHCFPINNPWITSDIKALQKAFGVEAGRSSRMCNMS